MAEKTKRLEELMPVEQAKKLPLFLQQMEGAPVPKGDHKAPIRVKKLVKAEGIQTPALVPSPSAKWISRMITFPSPHEA
ncbi:MAG: hypothetical protein AAFQ98_08250 [Bacteroidota bacterium]